MADPAYQWLVEKNSTPESDNNKQSPLTLASEDSFEVRSYFVRGRNALVTRADFSDLYVNHYLHLSDTGQRFSETPDKFLKEALAAVTLYAAARPHDECYAWTIHFESPLLNLFVNADNTQGRVTGTAFDTDVRSMGKNLFYSDFVRPHKAPRRSVIDFAEGVNVLQGAEIFMVQSEQRPGRFFYHSEEDMVFVSAQPDCDEEWLSGLTQEAIRSLDKDEELSLLEQRYYRLECGCSQEKIIRALEAEIRKNADAIFRDEASVRVQCPRCGRRHVITREAVEAFLSKSPSPEA
ncbi:MAG: Hsp33 family molecular chaperone HslO [Chthoniobacterales bacterium]